MKTKKNLIGIIMVNCLVECNNSCAQDCLSSDNFISDFDSILY